MISESEKWKENDPITVKIKGWQRTNPERKNKTSLRRKK